MIQYTKEYIGHLLERYMEGISTLEEEDILCQYFTRSDVPAEWEDYRQLFAEIDSMRPTEKSKRHWWTWSIAAAVVAVLVVFATTQELKENRPKSDVIAQVEEKEKPQQTHPQQTHSQQTHSQQTHSQQTHPQPLPTREGRNYLGGRTEGTGVSSPLPHREGLGVVPPQPTMAGYDKAYALMAEAAKEQQQAEQEIEQAQQEILQTQLIAAGYVAIQQEDGTIIYTNEPKEYFAYEE